MHKLELPLNGLKVASVIFFSAQTTNLTNKTSAKMLREI